MGVDLTTTCTLDKPSNPLTYLGLDRPNSVCQNFELLLRETDNKKNIEVFELKPQTTHGKSELIGYTDVPKFVKALKFHFNPSVILKDLSCVC